MVVPCAKEIIICIISVNLYSNEIFYLITHYFLDLQSSLGFPNVF